MRVRVSVQDPLPAYRRGIVTILEGAGLAVEEPEVSEGSEGSGLAVIWTSEIESYICLVTVDSPEPGDGWDTITQLNEREPRPVLIAVLANASVDAYMRALDAGATSAFSRDAHPEIIHRVFVEAVKERSVLPIGVISALLRRARPIARESQPSDEHLEWLRALAGGVPIAQLADTAGYSERAMYRLLGSLYKTIGVKNRSEAIIKASQSGWL
jgi:DNA-binding NarL/FixJ family response regulator